MDKIDRPKIKVDKIDNLNYNYSTISHSDVFRVFCHVDLSYKEYLLLINEKGDINGEKLQAYIEKFKDHNYGIISYHKTPHKDSEKSIYTLEFPEMNSIIF